MSAVFLANEQWITANDDDYWLEHLSLAHTNLLVSMTK